MLSDQFLFAKLSWPEIDAAAQAGKLILLPIATIEDHGLLLPVDTDVAITTAICLETAKLIPDEVPLMPTVQYGYSPHHLDFPGTVTIGWSIFVEYLLDILRSLIYYGFRKILIVNGHGSNGPLGEMGRKTGGR